MNHKTKEIFNRTTLDASLRRLGIVELDERLEFSPLLVESGLRGDTVDMQFSCCSCKVPDDYVPGNLPQIVKPWVGDGSTGPTDGGMIW